MNIVPTAIPDVLLVEPTIHNDERGFFVETWHAERYAKAGMAAPFVQDNQSRSRRGTLRGLHYQLRRPQGKLVRALAGEVYDVAVDLRRSSATFCRWIGVLLSDVNQRQLWVPPGFAHGFYVLSERADVAYKCTEYYVREDDRSLRWDDADLGIAWPLLEGATPQLSARDAAAPSIRDAPVYG